MGYIHIDYQTEVQTITSADPAWLFCFEFGALA